MRPQKVLDIDVLSSLVKVFRSKGYDGASLSELSESTGLKKASLYHRFPNGKQEMASAVLSHIDEWVEQNIFKALMDENKTPSERLINGLKKIRDSYDGGKEACVFRALSLGSSLELFSKQINQGMTKWVKTFERVGVALGLSNEEAQTNALLTLIEIQGSLVVTKGLNDVTIFENTLKQIESRYLKR